MVYKVVFVGDSSVGKTSIIAKVMNPGTDISISNGPTLGAAAHELKVNVDGNEVTLNMWDTAGQEVYQALAPQYGRDAVACFAVYDISQEDSFDNITSWVEMMTQVESIKTVIVVGNKADLSESRKIPFEKGLDYAEKNNYFFMEVSAKTGAGLSDLMALCASQIIQNYNKLNESANTVAINKSQQSKDKCGC